MEHLLTQENTHEKTSIKEGVDFVFEQYPELAEIGNKEQYSVYIETIFPESKIRDILYHGTLSDNLIGEEFDHNYVYNKKGVTYFGELKQADSYREKHGRGKIYAVLINLLKPYIQKELPEDPWATDQLQKEHLDSFKDGGYDGIIGYGIFGDKEKIVFEPEQIHILGFEKDKAGFKEFVEKTSS